MGTVAGRANGANVANVAPSVEQQQPVLHLQLGVNPELKTPLERVGHASRAAAQTAL